jgi:hypothetical protein
LILAVLFYSFSVKVVEAKGFVKAAASLFSALMNVIVSLSNAIVNTVLGISETIIGGITGISFLSNDGGCRLSNISKSALSIYAGKCGESNSSGNSGSASPINANSGNSPSKCWQVPVTMYIPPSQSYSTQQCDPDEKESQIALYRFSIPNSSSQSALNDWYFDQIKTKVGDGSTNDGYYYAPYYMPRNGEIWMTVPYSKICSNNVCKFNDDTVPEDSYVVYGAKIIDNYYKDNEGYCSWLNKFLNTDSQGGAIIMPSRSSGLGNAFSGPYNIGSCPPKVDLKINGSDGYNMYVPNTWTQLKWTTQKASNCVASGNWSGSKADNGAEDIGKLSRGTSNPGQGKTYSYTLSCQTATTTISDTASTTVFKMPDCAFSANPSVINILPATSTLSWNCWYPGSDESSVDSCSIDQGIGNVSSLPVGSVDVRPSQETTYTLSCSSLDGSANYQTSVRVGFRPRVREINPGEW